MRYSPVWLSLASICNVLRCVSMMSRIVSISHDPRQHRLLITSPFWRELSSFLLNMRCNPYPLSSSYIRRMYIPGHSSIDTIPPLPWGSCKLPRLWIHCKGFLSEGCRRDGISRNGDPCRGQPRHCEYICFCSFIYLL